MAEVAALLETVSDPAADLEIARAVGWLHFARYWAPDTGEDQQDLETALAFLEPVYEAHPDAVPDEVRAYFDEQRHGATDTPQLLSDRAVDLMEATMRTGDPSALDGAIDLFRQALDAVPGDHPDRAAMLSNVTNALLTRFERTGELADLDAAIEAGQTAADAVSPDDLNRAVLQSTFGGALWTRFRQGGVLADLDNAIEAFRVAVEATPSDHPNLAAILANLGTALHTRFQWTGELADLEAAIEAGQITVDATHIDHPSRGQRLDHFSVVLQTRFGHHGDLADLDAAIEAGQAAVETTPPDHPRRAAMLSNLGIALRTRFERGGQPADLDGAIEAGQGAVDTTPPDHPDRAAMLSNLGVALRTRFEQGGRQADLDDAIQAAQAAVAATPPDHPDRAGRLSNLADSLQTRFERGGRPADLDAAIDAYQAAAETLGAPPRIRAGAARGWGLAAAGGGRWSEAMTGFTTAIELLGQVAPRRLARRDQEHLLAELAGLGADAAACCLRVGLVERAVELFEQGRGVLLGQALDTRTDLTALAERHPELAASFTNLRDVLDRADDQAGPGRTEPGEGPSAPTGTERRAAGVAFDDLIANIRGLDGFERFLRPPPAAELLVTASNGPVVIVAVSEFGSYALLLTGGGVDAVRLAGLTPQTVYDQVVALLAALDGQASSRVAAQERIGEILGWLWDVLAGPVLDRLGIVGPPGDGGRWPRLWWCTSDLLSFLPVHAAGYHRAPSGLAAATVLDRVISSYTPTVRALAHARAASPVDAGGRVELGRGRMVAVAMPHTPGASDLPGAEVETAALRARFPGQVDLLTGTRATRQAVLSRLPTARWAHFACHATADLDAPSAGRLLLADHRVRPLSVLDVARLRLHDVELAFLSACSTARPGGPLADEAIHLASAFQLAGYRHVIATLWPIGDQHAAYIAEDIYGALAEGGDVSTAVHAAARASRGRWARMPLVWASHIHVGA
ncbi:MULTISPECIES: CHAT domain-containing tetratricopeptide repeat protein [Pseudofrankia]|uniref:CHAT domain-containing tetratricopeptide repeat protein n=1 Tax=Pseudofrankia saprophytica TaxID=298655 RepID=UPI001E466E8A|nr:MULTISPECIES: CHAT domain-containing protein [Pseudofrankia]